MNGLKSSQEYVDKIIGIDNLSRNVFYNQKYLEKDSLIHLMYELSTSEIILTKIGLEFLRDIWGFANIATILFDYEGSKGDFNINFKTKEKLVEWLKNYKTINC